MTLGTALETKQKSSGQRTKWVEAVDKHSDSDDLRLFTIGKKCSTPIIVDLAVTPNGGGHGSSYVHNYLEEAIPDI